MGNLNMGCKKQGAKNRVIVIQIEKRQPAPYFLQPILWTFFLKFQTLEKYQTDLIN